MFKLHSQLTTDDWAIYRQAGHVRNLARRVPDAAPLVAALDIALGHVDSGGATVMNPGEIAAATAAIYDADAALVAAIFNGWPPDREWPAPAQMVEDLIHDQATPTPVITIGASIERPLSAGRSFALESGSDQVEVSIREGTSKFDVIAALWRAVKLVETRWQLLLTDAEKVEETEEAQPVPVPAGGPEAMPEVWVMLPPGAKGEAAGDMKEYWRLLAEPREQLIFRVGSHGRLIPMLPLDEAGAVREPDGRTLLSATQAAEVSGLSRDAVATLYNEFFQDIVNRPSRSMNGSASATEQARHQEPDAAELGGAA